MNKQRRGILNGVLNDLDQLRGLIEKDEAIAILQNAQMQVEMCSDDEQMALDNRPESLMYSATSDDMNDNISDLLDAAGDLDVLADEISHGKAYDYDAIKTELAKIVNTIKQVIHR